MRINFEEALNSFSQWYETCLDNGLEPELVVESFGEMMLITDAHKVELVKEYLESL